MSFSPKSKDWVHFIGIGGAGMSAVANLAIKRQCKVSGSDIKYSGVIKNLEENGALVNIGHAPENIKPGINRLVYSSCIPNNNVEILKAQRLNIPIFHRSEFLSELMNGKCNIVICGSHGKTTVSALVYHILYNSYFNVSAAVGGNSNHSYEKIEEDTDYFVAEADESDGSFINLSGDYIAVNNLDRDHFDFYKNFDNMLRYFNNFLNNIKKSGCIFLNQNICKYKNNLTEGIEACVYTFGFNKDSDINASEIRFCNKGINFKLNYLPYFKNEEFNLKLPGMHNIENAMVAVGICAKLEANLDDIKYALSTFKGVRRRFQVRLDNDKVVLIEDYAHHPTEIIAMIDAVKKSYNSNRIIVIFQPHRYTRTQLLAKDLAQSLKSADILILTDIYSANEVPIPGVTAENIYKHIKGSHKNVLYLPIGDIGSYVIDNIKDKDLVLVLGAGDIYKVAEELERQLK